MRIKNTIIKFSKIIKGKTAIDIETNEKSLRQFLNIPAD